MTKYTKEQPRDGETILHCGHLDANKMEWFMFPEYAEFKRPDGSDGRARWVAQCHECCATGNLVVNGDDTWVGDAPAIKDVRG